MSSIAQTLIALPSGTTAGQLVSFRATEKLGPITLHFTPIPSFGFDGKPKALSPHVYSFQESLDGVTWTALGSSLTVSGEKATTLVPTKPLVRVNGYATNGGGGSARLDIHHVGRLFRGQIEFYAHFGRTGYTDVGDASPTVAEGSHLASANAPAAWPPAAAPSK